MELDIMCVSSEGSRVENQDTAGYLEKRGGYCLAVADGLGGYSHGKYASELGVSTVLQSFSAEPSVSRKAMERHLSAAGSRIAEAVALDAERRSMKTTLAAVLTDGRHLICGHVGDTRIYVFHNRGLFYRSRDHSLIWQWVEEGRLSEEEVRGHPKRNVLLSAMGGGAAPEVSVQAWSMRLKPGDGMLLCSDGFWELLTDGEMLSALCAAQNTRGWIDGMELLVENRQTLRSDNFTCLAAMVL